MAQYEELSIDQGSDVAIEIKLTNPDKSKKDLLGFSVDAQMRRTINTSDSDAVDFGSYITDPTTDGKVVLILTNEQTDALTPGRYFYDVELSSEDSNGVKTIERVLEGLINVTPSITRK